MTDDFAFRPRNIMRGTARKLYSGKLRMADPDTARRADDVTQHYQGQPSETVKKAAKTEIVHPKKLLATEDQFSWDLAREGSGKNAPVFDKLKRHPVVVRTNNKMAIIDGHHRSDAALQQNKPLKVHVLEDRIDHAPYEAERTKRRREFEEMDRRHKENMARDPDYASKISKKANHDWINNGGYEKLLRMGGSPPLSEEDIQTKVREAKNSIK